MVCWTATSDNGSSRDSVAREGPHRKTAEETADFRSIGIGAAPR